MKHLLKLKAIFFIMTLLLPATVTAYDFELDGIYYIINGNEAIVTYDTYDDYNASYTGDVIIPESITYSGVTYSKKGYSDHLPIYADFRLLY